MNKPEMIKELEICCRERIALGQSGLNKIIDKLNGSNPILYHSECRKPLVNKTFIERLRCGCGKHARSESVECTVQGPGRPCTSSSTPVSFRPKRQKTVPKAPICIFSGCTFCKYEADEELHRVLSDSMGGTLIEIKKNTKDDTVRTCVSDLESPGDASALEKYYHRKCLRSAQRTFVPVDKDRHEQLILSVCDEQLLLSVHTSLTDDHATLDMAQVNDAYVSILNSYKMETRNDSNYRKHLKQLITERLPDVQFVKPLQKYKPEKLVLPKDISKAINAQSEMLDTHDTIGYMKGTAKILREDMLKHRDWSFKGSFEDFENPQLLQFFLTQLLFGPHVHKVSERCNEDVQKTVDIACQFLIQNIHTNRQVSYQSKQVGGFRQCVDTPLSVGLPLAIHSRLRDKTLVNNMSDVYIGCEYKKIIDLEKRVEQGVLQRIQETGGYCLPEFVKKDVNIWFAVDNIDLLEDTPTGQNTFHGTVVVINQRAEDGEPLNQPLVIPEKLMPSESLGFEVKYLPEPVLKTKPLRFEAYQLGQRKELISNDYTHIWALAHYCNMSNRTADTACNQGVTNQQQEGSDAGQEETENQDTDQRMEHEMNAYAGQQSDHEDTQHNSPTFSLTEESQNWTDLEDGQLPQAYKDKQNSQSPTASENQEHEGSKETQDTISPLTGESQENQIDQQGCTDELQQYAEQDSQDLQDSILSVKERKQIAVKASNKEVMPTWAATKSLLSNTSHRQPRTNTEVLAPLFKTSPTDYATLYTVLMLTQGISACVVGPERKTLITLDLDLYNRAVQIQQSVGNTNWILRAGGLHIAFAALHALGKTIDGTGVDTCAIESGIYTSAALRGIFSGKAYRRGIQYHITTTLAIMLMKFDALSTNFSLEPLSALIADFTKSVHERSPRMNEVYTRIHSWYTENLRQREQDIEIGELAQFLTQYMEQVESLLNFIDSCRSGDWERYLAALENLIKYFFAHDLLNYSRLMPIYLAQMNALEEIEPVTWEALKSGDFVVTKSEVPFTKLFTDESLEQEIKELKRHGGIIGLSQSEAALDRLVTTTPHLAHIVNQYLSSFPRILQPSKQSEHHQLKGSAAVRIASNALKLRQSIERHCAGNPFTTNTPLKNLASSAVVPENAKDDLLHFAEKGQERFEDFIQSRLLPTSTLSVWDSMKKLKLKMFSSLTAKTKVSVGQNKVIKLREERELLGRFLIIQSSRPELVPKLEDTIGEFEMAVVPRSLFAVDGSLNVPTDKAMLMHAIEGAKSQQEDTDTIATDCLQQILIVDAMAVLQSMKKVPSMKTLHDLQDAFNKRIQFMLLGYIEGRIVFDRYLDESLKNKTRQKRATTCTEYEIHPDMKLTMPLRDLLSSTKTKRHLTCMLAEGLLECFRNHTCKLVVVYDNKIKGHHFLQEHSHEEADTLIPHQVLASVSDDALREVFVWSPDTDVLVLLLHLVANCQLGAQTGVKFLTGKGTKFRVIDVVERVKAIGTHKCQGLIGFHNFTGADWGGKFVGVTKKSWVEAFMKLQEDDPAIECFKELGEGTLQTELINGELPPKVKALEPFICRVYSSSGPTSLPALRWELFRSKNLEAEMLPPTRAALLPHILRANYVAFRDKSYHTSCPVLLPVQSSGWSIDDGVFVPLRCLSLPAPQAVIELTKCGCKTGCRGARCSCFKNRLPCTPLCKCYSTDCANYTRVAGHDVDEDDDE